MNPCGNMITNAALLLPAKPGIIIYYIPNLPNLGGFEGVPGMRYVIPWTAPTTHDRFGALQWHYPDPATCLVTIVGLAQAPSQASTQAIKQSSRQAIKQSRNQAVKQSSNQAMKQSGNQAIKLSSNQSSKPASNQARSQSGKHAVNQWGRERS
jgi:hypothetical protein